MCSGLCTLSELKDGTYDLEDLIEMHALLDVKDYVEIKSHEALNKGN